MISNLKKFREERNLSQSQLAKKAGVSLRMLQYYEQESKDIRKAQVSTVLQITRALDISVEDLFCNCK